jgi:hypothetical protein
MISAFHIARDNTDLLGSGAHDHLGDHLVEAEFALRSVPWATSCSTVAAIRHDLMEFGPMRMFERPTTLPVDSSSTDPLEGGDGSKPRPTGPSGAVYLPDQFREGVTGRSNVGGSASRKGYAICPHPVCGDRDVRPHPRRLCPDGVREQAPGRSRQLAHFQNLNRGFATL